MEAVKIQLTFDQLWLAVTHLPRSLKLKLYQKPDAELNSKEIENEFHQALYEVWDTYKHIPEEELNADIDLALEQVRAETNTRRP